MKHAKIIALSGPAGSGKSTAADLLLQLAYTYLGRNVRTAAFSDPMKEFCREVFDFDQDQLYGPSASRNAPDPRYTRADGLPLTPRHALQTLGTEWGRACFPAVWTAYAMRKALEFDGLTILSDCRFLNEARAVREAGGEVWLIDRDVPGLAADHASERDMKLPEFRALCRIVPNHKTLDDLRMQIAVAWGVVRSGGDRS